jgi:hypothetical protein
MQHSSLSSTKIFEISSLKEQIEVLTKSQDAAETRLVESNLAWERKLEDANQKRVKSRDKLVNQLAAARDKLDGEVKYLRNSIQKRATADERVREEEALNDKVRDLQEQNTQMAEVIHQMRHDMEAMQNIPQPKAV